MGQQQHPSMAGMPKIELHLHLEGAVRLETIRELSGRPGTPGTAQVTDALERLETLEKYSGLPQFIETMRTVSDTCFRCADDYGRVMGEVLEDLAKQNTLYAEISFDPARSIKINTRFRDILGAIDEARIKAEAAFGIKAGIIIGLSRERGSASALDFVRQAVFSKRSGVVGIDLHGNEEAAGPEEFSDVYEYAAINGLGLRAHAGEGSGPKSIWGAIGSLCVSRVGHGVRAIEDPRLLEYLREHPVTLDICPTSNYRLSICPDLREHPVRKLFDMGIQVSVSTDDPLYFRTTMNGEYELLHNTLGFTREELEKVTKNAVNGAFLSDKDKNALWLAVEQGFADQEPTTV